MIKFKSVSKVWLVASLIIVLLAAGMAGCGQQADKEKEPPKADAEPVTLLVSVAASLTDAAADLEKLYQKEHSNVSFTFNPASSGKLQQQIEQGAPADVFISAAEDKMDALEEKDLIIKETRKDILKNSIVLIVAKDNTAIKGFNDLSNVKGKIALGEPESVPVGKYAQESLASMNLWDQVQAKAVYAQDVRQVLAYVESGDAEAGIVYQTDAQISDKVKIAAQAEENTHSSLVYPVAVVKDSKNQEAARDFVDFLSSDEARAVFEKYGFITIK
ncbi:molybdate ABC transporter substrate-binding protein [Syntrophomonas curvata]